RLVSLGQCLGCNRKTLAKFAAHAHDLGALPRKKKCNFVRHPKRILPEACRAGPPGANFRSAPRDGRYSIPALLVVGIFVMNHPALAIEFHRASLRAHVHFELSRRTPAFPAVIAIAHSIQSLADGKMHALARRRASIKQSRRRATQ